MSGLERTFRGSVVIPFVGLLLAGLAGLLLLDAGAQGRGVAVERPAPEIGGGPWINSEPLGTATLRGRVVFVEFWTYG
jgi:hypothetical protein